MKAAARPVYLNLLRIRLPLPGWVSILHRISGALLFAALPAGVWLLGLSLSGDAGFQQAKGWVAHPPAKLGILVLVWTLAHHFLAGLRHLALDVHWGLDLKRARQTSLAVMLGAALVSVAAAWRLFG